jgi:hypothetical protein
MHIQRTVLTALASAGLAACGQAFAATPDASHDVDCSVVAFYFTGLAEHMGADPTQQRAVAAVHEWYSTKVQAIAREKGGNEVLNRAGPVLEAVKRDPVNMRDELAACTDRAVNEGLR